VDLLVGYGVEQPKVADLVGVSARTRNSQFGGGVTVNAHRAWKIGLESYRTLSSTQNASGALTRAKGVQIALATKLDF
jgi:hypothetical protein